MGFLAGLGESLNRTADLEHQAKLARQRDLMQSNLKVAELLLGSPDPEDHAKALAIFADPSKPFRTDKEHPHLQQARNIVQTLGSGAGGQAVASGAQPEGMAGSLGMDQSPVAQMYIPGEGGPDQGGPPPPAPPAPPLPPQPAAQTTAPPASMGGQLSPEAAMGGAPSPTPPAPQAPPAPGPPAPPLALAQPPPAPAPPPQPDALAQALNLAETQLGERPSILSPQAQNAWYQGHQAQTDRLQRAQLALAAGQPDVAKMILTGREGLQAGIEEMKQAGRGEDRASRERIAAERTKAVYDATQARIAAAQAARDQQWAIHKDQMGLAWQRLSQGTDKAAIRTETARLSKLQDQARQAQDFASTGIAGVENLRGLYQLYSEADSAKDKVVAWERFADAAGAEAMRITQAVSGPNIKGARMNEARVRAAVKEITTTHKAWIPGAPPIPLLAPDEVEKRLDNVRHLVEQSEQEARDSIQAAADNPPAPGKSPLTGVPERGRAVHGKLQEPPSAPAEVSGKIPAGAKVAKNAKTGQRIYSTDGGKTWHDAASGAEVK